MPTGIYDWSYKFELEVAPGSLTNLSSLVQRLRYDVALADAFRPLQPGQLLADLYAPTSLAPIRSGVTPARRVKLSAISDPAIQGHNGPAGSVVASWNAAYANLSGSNFTVDMKVHINPGSHTDQFAVAMSLPFGDSGDALAFGQGGNWNTNSPTQFGRSQSLRPLIFQPASFFGFTHHLTYVYTAISCGVGNEQYYWNGVYASSGQITSPSKTSSGGTPITIGGTQIYPAQPTYGGYGFANQVRDVRLWRRALDASEVKYHHDYPDALTTDGRSLLIAHWKCDEGSGANVQDFSTTANTAVFKTNSSNQAPSSWAALNPSYPLPGGVALFSGRAVDISYDPKLENRILHIEALDDVDRMRAVTINTSLFANYNAASLATEILTRCGIASFNVSSFSDTAPFAWYQERDAASALDDIILSGLYRAYVDGAGTLQLKNRYGAVFDTPVASYSTDNGSQSMMDLLYRLNRDGIVNSSKARGERRQNATSVGTIAFLNAPLAIPASGSVGFWLDYTDPDEPTIPAPATGIVTPVQSSDWYLATNSDGSGAELTSTASLQFTGFGASAVCSIFNGSGVQAWLTKFQIRGTSFQRRSPASGQYDDSSSQAVYGRRTKNLDEALFGDDAFLRDLTSFLVVGRKDPLGAVTLTMKNQFPDVHVRQVGDTVAVVDGVSGVNSNWFIRSAAHEVSLVNGIEHTASYELESFQGQDWLVLDHASFGKLDVRRLGL